MQWQRSAPKQAPSGVMSVSQLTFAIKDRLEGSFPNVWVEGELSGCKYHSSGHIYFTLKDSRAQISCAMWRSSARRLRMKLKDGEQVLVKGPIGLYAPRGSYQLTAESIEPRGKGALMVAFEQLKTKLTSEGLFDESHKQPLPSIPKRIGVVTSATGAAFKDVLQVLRRRFPKTEVLLAPARVQGEGAGYSVAMAIEALNKDTSCDVLLVTRGGGSLEDLWAFNEEVVARAIFASKIPIMSAVGHEVDYTIADFVADARAPTPSAAAELLVPDATLLLNQIEEMRRRLKQNMQRKLRLGRTELMGLSERIRDPATMLSERRASVQSLHLRLLAGESRQLELFRQQISGLEERLKLVSPARRLELGRERLHVLETRLFVSMSRRNQVSRSRLSAAVQVLDAVSPLRVLGRGYALVSDNKTGSVLRDVEDVNLGEHIHVRLGKGALVAQVTKRLPMEDTP